MKNKIVFFILLLIFTVLIHFTLLCFLKFLVSKHYIFDTIKTYGGFRFNFKSIYLFFLIPIIEELAFRLPLRKNLWYFTISSFILFTTLTYIIFFSLWLSFAIGLISSISIFILYNEALQLRKPLGMCYDKYYMIICGLSIFLFTLSHLPFRVNANEVFFLMPIILGAIAITIIRVKFNFWSGYLFHILLNASLKICSFVFPVIFGISI